MVNSLCKRGGMRTSRPKVNELSESKQSILLLSFARLVSSSRAFCCWGLVKASFLSRMRFFPYDRPDFCIMLPLPVVRGQFSVTGSDDGLL